MLTLDEYEYFAVLLRWNSEIVPFMRPFDFSHYRCPGLLLVLANAPDTPSAQP